MFKEVKNNRLFILLLSTVGLIVWGNIAWKLIFEVDTNQESEVAQLEVPTIVEHKPAVEMKPLTAAEISAVRDPFQRGRVRPAQEEGAGTRSKQQVSPSEPPPLLKLVALILDNEGRLALLENSDGETYICKEGDEVGGARLLRIMESAVDMQFKSKRYSVELEKG